VHIWGQSLNKQLIYKPDYGVLYNKMTVANGYPCWWHCASLFLTEWQTDGQRAIRNAVMQVELWSCNDVIKQVSCTSRYDHAGCFRPRSARSVWHTNVVISRCRLKPVGIKTDIRTSETDGRRRRDEEIRHIASLRYMSKQKKLYHAEWPMGVGVYGSPTKQHVRLRSSLVLTTVTTLADKAHHLYR